MFVRPINSIQTTLAVFLFVNATMTTMKKFLVFACLFLTNYVFAQDSLQFSGPMLVVHKDSRIDALVKKQAAINDRAKKISSRTMRGYRLLVLNTNIYKHFPDQKAYLTYQSPFFRLKAGNFQTRDEAVRYQKLMNTIFQKGVFIVSETIEVKAEKDPMD
jgi:hypothetical protein